MLNRPARLRAAVPAAVLLAGAGCASAPPVRAPQPDLTLPAAWTAPDTVATAPSAAPWWTSFGAPGLESAVVEALARNPNLQAAAARVEQAEASARAAGAGRQPQLAAAFDATRSRRNFIGFPIPGGDGGVLSTTTTNLGVSLNVSWEPDLWGRLKSGEIAALADRTAAAALYESARLSLAAQTAKAWLAAVEARQQVDLARRTLDSRRETVTRVGLRYEQGLRPSIDVRLAQSAVAGAEAALAGRERQLDAAIRQLEVLLGRYPAGTLTAADALPSLGGAVPAGLPADLIARRPDLLAAEMALVASGARVSSARAQLLPQIRLTGSTGTASSALLDLLSGDFAVWSLVGGLTQPLFQGGRIRADVDAAEARREEAVATYAERALQAFAEVELALNADRFLAEQARALAAAHAEAVAAQQVAEDRYFAGLSSYLDVLESQRQAVSAESQWLDALRLRLATRVDLHLALGGEFPDLHALAGDPSRKESHR